VKRWSGLGYLLTCGAGNRAEVPDFGGGLGVRYTKEQPASRRPTRGWLQRWCIRSSGAAAGTGALDYRAGGDSAIARGLYQGEFAQSFVVIDAAMNDLIRPVLYDAPHPVTRVSEKKAQSRARERVDVVGPVCETGDVSCKAGRWARSRPGCGSAVGRRRLRHGASLELHGRGRPAEVLVEGKRARLIRRRETQDDVLRTDALF